MKRNIILIAVFHFTNNRRSDNWGDTLEHEQQSESICKFVKAKEVDQDNTGEADIGPGGDAEDGAVDGLGGVGVHEHGETHRDAADDEAGVVQIQSVDPLSITEPAKAEPRHSVTDPYHQGELEGGRNYLWHGKDTELLCMPTILLLSN